MGIFNFATKQDFDNHTPSTTDSEVYHIDSTDDILYSPINTEVVYPKWGDALYIDNIEDANGKYGKHFIDGDSLDSSLLPNTWTPVGVVFANHRNKVYIHHYQGYNGGDNTVQWASAWLYEITDMPLDGSEHSIVFQQPKSSGTPLEVGTFTYTSSTLEAFCSVLDTWLRNNQGGTAAGGSYNYNWHCEYMENYAGVMSCIVIVDNIQAYQQYDTSNPIVKSGATCNLNMANMVPAYTLLMKKNGGNASYYQGANYKRLLEWGNSNTTISTITSNIPVNSNNTIVSRTQFNENQYCGLLRDAYGTYENYIAEQMVAYPTVRSLIGYEHGNVRKWNDLLKNRTHKKLDGSVIPTFRPFNYAGNLNVNSVGLESGNWYVPGIEEQYWIMKDLTYGLSGISTSNCDRFNRTLSKMGGNLVSVAADRWVAVRYSYRRAWFFYNTGFFNNSSFYNSFRLSVVCALSI